MSRPIDFNNLPAQRRRRREHAFYRALAACTLAGALPILAQSWRLRLDTADLQAAAVLVEQALQAVQPSLASIARTEQQLTMLLAQQQGHATQAAQRAQAPTLLLAVAVASASAPGLELLHMGLRGAQAELRGRVPDQETLQGFIDGLRQEGLQQVVLQELRARHAARPRSGYTFALTLQVVP